jgi:glutathione S-transferase
MLALYHNAASTCSQKVRLVLAEKGIPYESHDIDLIGGGQHDAAYVKLNPNHVVPTIVHDGSVFIESTLINEYLDDAFPDPPMRPADAAGRHAMRSWTKRIDDKVHPAAGVITFGIGARPILLQRTPEQIDAQLEQIPDPVARARRRSVVENGVKAPEVAGAVAAFVSLCDDMEAHLGGAPWLAGEAPSLADAAALPYVMRLDHLAMDALLSPEARPALADWYDRVRARPSFKTAVADVLPEPVVQMFRSAGEAVWADVEPLTRAG